MNNHVSRMAGLLGLALTLALFSPPRAAADENDPPGRVARLGYAHGAVSFQPGGTDEWVDARINRPMTTGDKLWSDAGGLAEMNTGSAYIRVGSSTGFSFLNLSDYATQIQITEGTLLVRLRRLDQNETFEIDTPNLAFSIYQAGTYKVTVNQTGDVTDVQVRQGQGEVTGGGASYTLQAGDEGRFSGTDGLVADIGGYQHQSDNFENWSSQRDRRIDHSYSSRYVSPDVIGSEDLDQYGGWRSSGEYGNVWYPHTTEVGWAPYHNGHWAYIAPWGYTWVDDEPWGFAPFHYGRWVNVQGAWGWVPGRRESDYGGGEAYVRPVYAPALVAWVGGAHFAIGISVGGGGGYSQGESVGWFPLGPREVYVPSYPVSRTYVNNVNVSNTNVTNTVVNNYYNTTVINNTNNTTNTNVNVTNVKYVNQAVPGAVTATTPQAFVSAQPVAKNIVQVNQREIATAPVRIAAPPVAPSKEAVLGTAVRASAKPPEAVVNRTVVAKVAPPAPPVPFVQQQKAIEANGGKPLPGAEIHQMQVKEQQQVQRAPQPQQQHTPSGQPAQAPPQVQQTPQQAVRIAPPAQPQAARPAQAQANTGNRPPATPNNPQEQNNRPANQNTQQLPPQSPPQQANRPGQPVAIQPNQPQNGNPRAVNDRPPSARPANTPDPALEQKHQQELEQLHKQQDQERQRVEQQQQQARKVQDQKAADQLRLQQQQQAQKNADQQQQLDRKAQEQKAADQQRLQQQQQAQRNADQQQQQDRKAELQKVADQQRLQQQQQAQRNADQQQLAQKNADQQRQQQQQLAQRNADQQRQQIDQRHQQELVQLEQKHAQEQQLLNQKHEQEHQQQARPQPPPPPQEKAQRQPPPPPPPPQKDKEKPKSDRPPPPPLQLD